MCFYYTINFDFRKFKKKCQSIKKSNYSCLKLYQKFRSVYRQSISVDIDGLYQLI